MKKVSTIIRNYNNNLKELSQNLPLKKHPAPPVPIITIDFS